jgi:soluble lytic murein transglycosylase-like protein
MVAAPARRGETRAMTKQALHSHRHTQRPAARRTRRRALRLLGAGAFGLVGGLALGPAAAQQTSMVPATPAVRPSDPVGAVASALTECSKKLDREQRWHIARVIHEQSTAHGYDPLLITALVQVESGCSATARGGAAIGLTQLLPSTARGVAPRAGVVWRGAQTLNDPHSNVRIGVRYLRELETMLDDPYRAVAAYNMGPRPVLRMSSQRAQRVGYVRKVMARYERLRAQYA